MLMKQTDLTLLEQLRITEFEIEHRQQLFNLTDRDVQLIVASRPIIETAVDSIVGRFYEHQTNVPEIALLIGDADTLERLRNAQRRYITDLFSGVYDIDYVNNRLRIGLVHKRIGVDTKLYLSAVYTLKSLIGEVLSQRIDDPEQRADTLAALEKLFMFDITLVFETYIRSLLSEIETSREKSEQYARSLEDKVRERTRQLEEMARTDPLTGLQSVRYLRDSLTRYLRISERRFETLSLVYIDINDFKQVNDTEGHQRGDEILRTVGDAIKAVSRAEDGCFRYGGDEFCVILPGCTKTRAREIYVDRLNKALADSGENIELSVGIAETGPEHYLGAEALIREADRAMYDDKAGQKGQPMAASVTQLKPRE
jgi:diguanylate cyclase (GGDEF)-like protein